MAQIQPAQREKLLNIDLSSCENIADLFQFAQNQNFDDNDFIEKYMNSRFANNEMDAVYSYFHTAWYEYVMDEILDEIRPKKNHMHYDTDAIEWIGYMYRYIHIRLGTPSSIIYKTLPLSHMLTIYEGMHTMSEEYFIDDIKEDFPEVFYE